MFCAEVAQFRRDMVALDLGSMSCEEQRNAMFAAVSHITELSRSVTSQMIAGGDDRHSQTCVHLLARRLLLNMCMSHASCLNEALPVIALVASTSI